MAGRDGHGEGARPARLHAAATPAHASPLPSRPLPRPCSAGRPPRRPGLLTGLALTRSEERGARGRRREGSSPEYSGMAGGAGRRRHREAAPGKGGEGNGTRRSCGSGREGSAGLAAARVRQEPHSNRPLAMTQQHAVRPPGWRRRGAGRRGGAWRAEGRRGGEGAGIGGGPRDGGRGAWARGPCATRRSACALRAPAPARRPRGLGPAHPGGWCSGNFMFLRLLKKSFPPFYKTVGQ